MRPSVGPIAATRLEVRVERGLVLPGRAWVADRPRALIALVHGLGEHSGRYAALAADLVAAGYSVAAVDLPGHGEGPGPRGDVPSWIDLRDRALPALWTTPLTLPGQPSRLPRVLLGHSMGAALALDYALAHPREIVGVVASAPALKTAMPPWWKLVLANVARATTPSLGFPHGLDESGISRDAEVMRERADDRLMHSKISPRLYHDLVEAQQRVMRDARRLAVPALLIQGDADPASSIRAAPRSSRPRRRRTCVNWSVPGSVSRGLQRPDRARAVGELPELARARVPSAA